MIVRLGRYLTFRTQCRGGGGYCSVCQQHPVDLPERLLTRTAKTASGRFWWLTGKRWWQVHRKPPETRLIYFTHMHSYSHHRIAGDFGREKGPGR